MIQKPTLAQLVERRTVVGKLLSDILRSLVRIRQVGLLFYFWLWLSVGICDWFKKFDFFFLIKGIYCVAGQMANFYLHQPLQHGIFYWFKIFFQITSLVYAWEQILSQLRINPKKNSQSILSAIHVFFNY